MLPIAPSVTKSNKKRYNWERSVLTKTIFLTALELRHLPTYSVAEAARYLKLPVGTLRSWVYGRPYPTKSGKSYFTPLIELPSSKEKQLSFTNLIEAHVLSAIRRVHKIPLSKVRTALDYITQKFPIAHPLARREFKTDGIDLFIEQFEDLIAVSREGQLAMREVLETFLNRIELDEKGLAEKFYPFSRSPNLTDPRVVIIDPRISFGRPVLVGTGIPTTIIAERYKAGESLEELAEDYDCDRAKIEEAIRCELTIIA